MGVRAFVFLLRRDPHHRRTMAIDLVVRGEGNDLGERLGWTRREGEALEVCAGVLGLEVTVNLGGDRRVGVTTEPLNHSEGRSCLEEQGRGGVPENRGSAPSVSPRRATASCSRWGIAGASRRRGSRDGRTCGTCGPARHEPSAGHGVAEDAREVDVLGVHRAVGAREDEL